MENAENIKEPMYQNLKAYEGILNYYTKNPEKVTESRTYLDELYTSIKDLREVLERPDASLLNLKDKDGLYLKIKGLEKRAKSLLMADLIKKIKKSEEN